MRTVWSGRNEDKADDNVWAVTCFVARKGYRRRGITYSLAAATIDHARRCGAAALEAYPMLTLTVRGDKLGVACSSHSCRRRSAVWLRFVVWASDSAEDLQHT